MLVLFSAQLDFSFLANDAPQEVQAWSTAREISSPCSSSTDVAKNSLIPPNHTLLRPLAKNINLLSILPDSMFVTAAHQSPRRTSIDNSAFDRQTAALLKTTTLYALTQGIRRQWAR
jgi:hypothetical protein